MPKALLHFSLYSFSQSFHLLLIAIQRIQDFLCFIVHLIYINTSLPILITRPPIIPIAIEITNICPKLKEFVYVMQRTIHISKTYGKESKNLFNIPLSPLYFIYIFYCSFEIKFVQKFHLDNHFTKKEYEPLLKGILIYISYSIITPKIE